ncbi:MAG: hypothetical protein KOO63_08490 [Bacteroidales bacterium]|nr:hypothetical protein [Candidatus Latescibacterota bacterium]
MKRVLLTVAVALLIPGLLMAQAPTLGVYFSGKLHTTPALPMTPFNGYLYIVQDAYFVTAVEYQLVMSPNLILGGVSYPSNFALEMGDPLAGHAITFWPPMTGYPDGYDLLATYTLYTSADCAMIPNSTLAIGPHPDSGELRGTYSPDNETFPIIGLTSFVCPSGVANDDASWGAIKSLYE